MQNIYDLLKRKELELERIKTEIEALRLTIRLLEGSEEAGTKRADGRSTAGSFESSRPALAPNKDLGAASYVVKPKSTREFP